MDWTTYFVQGSEGGPIKIGRALDVTKRIRHLQTSHPYPLILLATLNGDHEPDLHSRFAEHRTQGEWFNPHPALLGFISGIGSPEGEVVASRVEIMSIFKEAPEPIATITNRNSPAYLPNIQYDILK